MIMIDKQSRIPIYEQLIDGIKKEIVSGCMKCDELIPSVRAMSMELSINPNTVQKAYNELERRGITHSVPGVGRYVSAKAIDVIKQEMGSSEELLKKAVHDLKIAGYAQQEIIEKVNSYYGGVLDD